MNTKFRIIIPLVVLALAGVAFIAFAPVGTLSAFGWRDIAIICPLGALATMIAAKAIIPRAVVSLVLAIIAIFILGRMYCGWVCPVPVFSKLRNVFKSKSERSANLAPKKDFELTEEELASLKGCKGGCGSCASKSGFDSRHIVLLAALISTALFGFPVFCLICPIGLSFGLVFVLITLFGTGDLSWTVVVIPALLLVEVVFFRKWCTHICPLGALMSLVSKPSKTLRPTIDDSKCLETSTDATCGKCATVCEVGIDPRHPEKGANFAECLKCRACVEACPGNALSLPFIARKKPELVEAKATEKETEE